MDVRIKGLWIFFYAFFVAWGSWEELRRQAQGIYWEDVDADEAEGWTEEQWEQWKERRCWVDEERKAEFWSKVEAGDGAEENDEDEKSEKRKNMVVKKDACVKENNMVVRKNSKKKWMWRRRRTERGSLSEPTPLRGPRPPQ
jgi:hypothetical protein